MIPQLFLTSAGIVPEVRDSFLSLLPKKESHLLFITTAALGESKNPVWLESDRQKLRNCGIQHIDDFDLQGKSRGDLEKSLAKKDIVYVNGGNTFYLLYHTRKSGFDKVIGPFLERGGLYVGVSAGSYLAGPTIEQATWKHQDRNRIGITDFTALNLVPFLISAHFEEKYRGIIDKAAKNTTYPILALNDKQAVMVKGTTRVVGQGIEEWWNRSF